MIEALRLAIVLKWENKFAHDVGEGFRADVMDSISYNKLDQTLVNKLTRDQKASYRFRDLSRYSMKIAHESSWSYVADQVSGAYTMRLQVNDSAGRLNDDLFKITAHIVSQDSSIDETKTEGQITLDVRETLLMMKMGLENLAEVSLAVMIEKVQYNKRHSDWDLILKKCCTVQPDGKIFIDEMLFSKERYGFDPSQARADMQAVKAALLMQKAIRAFLAKVRHSRLLRTPGYAYSTGVYHKDSVYLVYLLKASSDMSQFFLTLKQRTQSGDRAMILDRVPVKESIVEQSRNRYPDCQFAL